MNCIATVSASWPLGVSTMHPLMYSQTGSTTYTLAWVPALRDALSQSSYPLLLSSASLTVPLFSGRCLAVQSKALLPGPVQGNLGWVCAERMEAYHSVAEFCPPIRDLQEIPGFVWVWGLGWL